MSLRAWSSISRRANEVEKHVSVVQSEVEPLRNASREVRELAEPVGWNSAIVTQFPKLFENFKKKQFALLWRGSRNGFHIYDFHGRCDWHPNTLSVILDTQGNIFGGFTRLKWESRKWNMGNSNNDNRFKADPSPKNFLFMLKNLLNVPARRFALKAEKKERALDCRSDKGPIFYSIHVSNYCNKNSYSYTSVFGSSLTNDTELDENTFFTGSANFQVKEIEMFEITNETALPLNSACVLFQNCF
jgi:hypothetical protein